MTEFLKLNAYVKSHGGKRLVLSYALSFRNSVIPPPISTRQLYRGEYKRNCQTALTRKEPNHYDQHRDRGMGSWPKLNEARFPSQRLPVWGASDFVLLGVTPLFHR